MIPPDHKPAPRQINTVLWFFICAMTLAIGLGVAQYRREKEKPVDLDAVKEAWRTNATTNPVPNEVRP